MPNYLRGPLGVPDPAENVRIVGSEELRKWRSNLPPGAVRQVLFETHTPGLSTVSSQEGPNTGVMAPGQPRHLVEPREVVERMAQRILTHLYQLERTNPERYREKIRELKARVPGLSHYTDEALANDMSAIARKWAEKTVESTVKRNPSLDIDMKRFRGGIVLEKKGVL